MSVRLVKEDILGCSYKFANEAAGEKRPQAYQFSLDHPDLPKQRFPQAAYGEGFLGPRTKLGTCFSILR